jgi:succinate dehydrogenase / fumarate reductase membrane anchor subunit
MGMLTNITSLTGNGLKDWLLQRASALVILTYFLFIFITLVTHPNMEYWYWHELFACSVMKIATMMVMLAVLIHAWIGVWTVTTDYLKCTVIRLGIQGLVALGLLAEVIWGIMIVWGQ